MLVEVVADRQFEFSYACEGAAPDAFRGDLSEEALDEVEPGGARRRVSVVRVFWTVEGLS